MILEAWFGMTAAAPSPAALPRDADPARTAPKRKLTCSERQEWEQMESRILAPESEVRALQSRIDDPAVLKDHAKLRDLCTQLETAERQVECLYTRWSDLESRQF